MTGPVTIRRLGGRYRLLDPVACGGMGEVWLARDERLERLVAVKLLRPEFAADPTFRQRFRNEARHAAALSHPGIATVHDYSEGGPEGPPYLVMEYVEGEPLSQLLAREGRLPARDALDIVGQVGLALQAAHDAGVVHRDVKPGNILLRRAPAGGYQVKVTDFGIARALGGRPLTRAGEVVGTAHYLSPEQAGGRPLTPASDVYALGVVGFECLTGRRPFDADSPVAIASAHLHAAPPTLPATFPPAVRRLIASALAKDPASRPPSAGGMGAQARRLAAAEPPPAAATGGRRPARRASPGRAAPSRGRAAVLVTVVLLVALVPAVVVALARQPAAITVHRAGYLGRPAPEVSAELRRLGLGVRQRPVSGRPAGTVLNVEPTGALARGSIVTISVSTGQPGRGN